MNIYTQSKKVTFYNNFWAILIVPLQITQANDQTWDIILKPSSYIAQIKIKKL